VYSLGVSIWESFTRGRPFEGLAWQDLGRSVCMEQKRPQWPTWSAQFNVDADNYAKLTHLVNLMWQGEPKTRPNIEKVKLLLSQVKTCKPAAVPAGTSVRAPAEAPAAASAAAPAREPAVVPASLSVSADLPANLPGVAESEPVQTRPA
jgi:hypothetical protein